MIDVPDSEEANARKALAYFSLFGALDALKSAWSMVEGLQEHYGRPLYLWAGYVHERLGNAVARLESYHVTAHLPFTANDKTVWGEELSFLTHNTRTLCDALAELRLELELDEFSSGVSSKLREMVGVSKHVLEAIEHDISLIPTEHLRLGYGETRIERDSQ